MFRLVDDGKTPRGWKICIEMDGETPEEQQSHQGKDVKATIPPFRGLLNFCKSLGVPYGKKTIKLLECLHFTSFFSSDKNTFQRTMRCLKTAAISMVAVWRCIGTSTLQCDQNASSLHPKLRSSCPGIGKWENGTPQGQECDFMRDADAKRRFYLIFARLDGLFYLIISTEPVHVRDLHANFIGDLLSEWSHSDFSMQSALPVYKQALLFSSWKQT